MPARSRFQASRVGGVAPGRGARIGAWAVRVAVAWLAVGVAGAEVALRLRIPAAETWVIGDAIPLNWQFQNQSTQALGFMWEGCCRLNGKLEVRRADEALAMAPPGQALAHMFAKADRLDPGVPKEYDTRVGDWVVLPGTGTYQLRGTYRGVLPFQQPQVQRGLALWRDAALSAPVSLTVLGVEDYLGQRSERERRRGLRLTLEGPPRLPALEPAGFRLLLENLSDQVQQLTWPDDESLWVLDDRGERVALAAVIPGAPGLLEIPARGRVERAFTLSSDPFEGEVLGDYRLFVDLASPSPDRPRVPSTVHRLAWRLTPVQVGELVVAASRGAGTGARNAPLKLLRVYLGELGPVLEGLDRAALPGEALPLRNRLVLASRLKPVAPKPGTVELVLEVPAGGPTRWSDPRVAAVVGGGVGSSGSRWLEVLAVRRHLGWEIGVALQPAPETPLSRLFEVERLISVQGSELAGPVAVRWGPVVTNVPPAVVLAAGAPVAGPLWRITSAGNWESSPDGVRFVSVAGEAALREAVGQVRGGGVQVVAPGELSWETARRALEALLAAGARVQLRVPVS